MNILYYGNGSCTIEGSEIRGVQISYRGSIAITKTAGDNFHIVANDRKIVIFPLGDGYLNDLFTYTGEFKITSIIVADKDGEKVLCKIKRVMDYSELLNSNSEDMTTKSEDLNSGHIYKKRVRKTSIDDNIIKNQHSNNELYLEDGTAYSGAYHIHGNGKAMTGGEHTEQSVDLYILRIEDNKLINTDHFKVVQPKKMGKRVRKVKVPSTTSGGGGGY